MHSFIHPSIHPSSVSDDIDEADLDAELAALEDDLEGLDVEEATADSQSTPAYLQPCKSMYHLVLLSMYLCTCLSFYLSIHVFLYLSI